MSTLGSSIASLLAVCVSLACVIAGGWSLARHQSSVTESRREPESLTADGIENLWRLPLSRNGSLFSGGQPDGAAGFASLKKLGVRTVISVDGAPPDVELAAKYGLRYVHLPIGYDDVPADRLATMVAAVQSLPGPVLVHCHHGKHRGPAAAVCVWRALRNDVSPDAATAVLHSMGTAEKYRGLYRAASRVPPADRDIQLAPREFPTVTAVAPLAEQMVGIDHVWEQIRVILKSDSPNAEQHRKANELWTNGAEQFREASRLMNRANETVDADLRNGLLEAAELWDSAASTGDADWLLNQRAISQQIERQCQQCHARHRDGQ